MAVIEWRMIQDGGAFESLMHAVLFAEDPGIILFGRSGKDAAQDARSTDGTVVYQAKYRQNLVMDDVIRLALDELDKIKKYQDRNSQNYKHWQNARKWILVANIEINPNNDQKWKDKITPAFLKVGIKAEYWDKEILEGKLISLPEIRDVFFKGGNRVFVGLKEAHELLKAERVGSMSYNVNVVGRDVELKRIKTFVAGDKAVLPVIGPGGIGKSRLLYESLVALSQDGWRVLWALTESMSLSAQWFKLLNSNQQTCVVIDNPDNPGILRAVIEQLATVERKNWRILVALRSERAETLRRYLTNLKVEAPLVLKPLDEPETKQLVQVCIGRSIEEAWLHSVYTYTKGNAGWLCLIAELVKNEKLTDLPANVDGVASFYLESCLECIDAVQKKQAETLIRWLVSHKETAPDPWSDPKLWENLMGEGSKGVGGFLLHQPLIQAYGWPVRVSYKVRNSLVHDGGDMGRQNLFRGDQISDGYLMHQQAIYDLQRWCDYKNDNGKIERCCLQAVEDPWPSQDLLRILEKYHMEIDLMLACLVKWCVESLVGQVKGFSQRDEQVLKAAFASSPRVPL